MLTIGHVLAESRKPARRKTKIIATIGPATSSPERMAELIDNGVNVFRLNFSHGTHEEHLSVLNTIREIAKNKGVYVAILQDLCGPKIRISKVKDDAVVITDGGSIELLAGKDELSDGAKLYVESVDPVRSLKVGQQILLSDGSIVLEARQINQQSVLCNIVKGGRLRSRVGIAFPDSNIDLAATTPKDFKDLEWGIANDIDYVALSFVRNAQDILVLRDAINRSKRDLKIIAKIERKVALENIEEILDVADGIMVARGDLGLELALEKLPIIQKLIIERANYKGIPVIVATQMLQSMVTSVRPTRAEVADVSLAVLNGADAVMLSEETAIGQNPIECVKYLNRIALEAERRFHFDEYKWRLRGSDADTIPDAVMYAACGAAIKINAAAIIACTETGTSARLTAKYRPQQPLYAVSSKEKTLKRLCLCWGVIPIACATTETHNEELLTALKQVQIQENLPNGSKAVVTGGISAGKPGTSSVLEIREMNFI